VRARTAEPVRSGSPPSGLVVRARTAEPVRKRAAEQDEAGYRIDVRCLLGNVRASAAAISR
jgi:hypothetical protein